MTYDMTVKLWLHCEWISAKSYFLIMWFLFLILLDNGEKALTMQLILTIMVTAQHLLIFTYQNKYTLQFFTYLGFDTALSPLWILCIHIHWQVREESEHHSTGRQLALDRAELHRILAMWECGQESSSKTTSPDDLIAACHIGQQSRHNIHLLWLTHCDEDK